jgi:DNA (cytosine-5)-methyltransferase 1
MRYGSVCSGVEAATVAWHDLGWEPAFFSEIEAFPRAVLEHHYPDVPVHGDFTTIKEKEYGSIDLLVGGTPCQSFSVAGLRGGMDDERGNLALEFVRLAQRERPQWLVWENVPGVLSSNGGRDFGSLLGALAHIGYGFAYRVLDAQFFGVPQRRRRVFLVGYLGDWRPPAAVLFERESLSGNPPPSREAKKEAARNAGGCTEAGGRQWPADVACTLNAAFADKHGLEDQHALNGASLFVPEYVGTLTAKGPPSLGRPEVDGNHILPYLPVMSGGQANASLSNNLSPTLNCNCDGVPIAFPSDRHAVAFTQNQRDEVREMPYAGALSASSGAKQTSYVRNDMQVRRLTPRECERLQGFPDDYTQIPYRNKAAEDCPKGPRYKAMGNSMAVPVMSWIGKRISKVSGILLEENAEVSHG